jgi:hypothetical protein
MASVLLLGSCHGVLQGRQTTGSGALDAARRRAAPGGACSRRRSTETTNPASDRRRACPRQLGQRRRAEARAMQSRAARARGVQGASPFIGCRVEPGVTRTPRSGGGHGHGSACLAGVADGPCGPGD